MDKKTKQLTLKQKKVFDFIASYINKFGLSPTLKEIQNEMGVNSIRGVTQFLEALEKKNLIYRTNDRQRNIKVHEEKWFKLVNIPVVSAGCDNMNIFAEQKYDEFIMVDKDLVKNKEIVAVRAEGDSMQEAQINSGDYLLVEKTDNPENDSIVLAIVDGMTVIKRLNFSQNAIILNPEPINDDYKPIIIKENNLKICGKVLDIIKNPKHKDEEIQYVEINE